MFLLTLIALGLTCFIFFCNFSESFRTVKKAFIWIYLWRLKKSQKRIFQYSPDTRDIRKAGLLATTEEWFREKPRPLFEKPHIADAVEFWGVDNNGNALNVCYVQRQDRVAEARIYLKLKSGEEYQSVLHPDTRISDTGTTGTVFSAGGLVLEVLDPLRTWRILFRGMLRKGIHQDWIQGSEELVKVCFTFIWHPAYHHFVLNQNFSINIVSEAISKMRFSPSFLKRFKVSPIDQYEQWGQMTGTLQIDGDEETQLNLWGPKSRSYGTLNWKDASKKIRLFLHVEDGSVLSLEATDNYVGLKDITHGYIAPASGFGNNTISKIDLNLTDVFSGDDYPKDIKCTFVARNETSSFHITMEKHYGYRVFAGNDWDAEVTSKIVSGSFNGDKCVGFVEFTRPYPGKRPAGLSRQKSLPLLKELDVVNCDRLVVKLEDPACRNSNFVGGKGASLALMVSIKNPPEKFEIPPGICLTKTAFLAHLRENPDIQGSITRLENIARKLEEGCLKTQCEKVVKDIENSKLSSEIQAEIKEQLTVMFKDRSEDIKLAIRSSAVGEDGSEMSAAGQNETVLGTFGHEQICEAVLKCWASQFAFRAIEYKRQNGQLLNPGMGVVIQQMVASETSGVIFTGDPVTGAYGSVAITANYGLGETVVSAVSDPDTIILRRSLDDQMSVLEKQIGKKRVKTTLKIDGQGTEEQRIQDSEAARCTLSDDMALKLGRIAVFLERSFGGPRDIEWAICNDRISLLQCRPVTTASQATQYEIFHEFDSPRITDQERFTRANVGEVMPGALSPLTITTIKRMWAPCTFNIVKHAVDRFWYNPLATQHFGAMLYCNQFVSDRIFTKVFGLSEKPSPFNRASQLGIHGRIVDDDDYIHAAALKRYPLPKAWTNLKSTFRNLIKDTLFGKGVLEDAVRRYGNYSIPLEGYTSPKQLYHKIEDCLFDAKEMFLAHVRVSLASMVWNLFTITTLSAGASDYTTEHYNDFAMMVGKSNGAVSGDVPFGLKELATAIKKERSPEEFSSLDPEVALNWLKAGTSEACLKFHSFLRRHGHRGHKEYELNAISWDMEPLKLIKVLQTMVAVTGKAELDEPNLTVKEVLERIKTPLTPMKKRFLSFILPRCRRAVPAREQAKTMLIKVNYCIRFAYLRLGEMLVNEGRIPDARFIFFLTHEEIGRLITHRSARIINRAAQRQRHYHAMDSLHYREFINGDPKAIEEEDAVEDALGTCTKITAYPVCQGTAKGTARVIRHIDEVDQIRAGDILVTFGTDIAWSPYFPLLSGVVTEIGGLISHGAVVAREYGIPCIVGAEGAMRMFKSGDLVLLNATRGTLEKIGE